MELEEALTQPEGPRQTAAIVAWVQGLFSDEPVPVLVGGAAVEILTGGAYTTGDLDFVGHVPASVQRRLQHNGFRRSGRHWIQEDVEIFLEFPGDALDPNEEAVRWQAYGYDVVLVSVADLLVDRLGLWDYWKSGVDGANAFQLYRTCRSEIDEERLTLRAGENGFGEALEALRRFDARWTDSEPDPRSLEEWANRGPQRDST